MSGTLSQQNDSSLLPAYLMSLGFTLSLGKDTNGIYWPGSPFAMVIQIYSYSYSILFF